MRKKNMEWVQKGPNFSHYNQDSENLVTLFNTGDLDKNFAEYSVNFFHSAEKIMDHLLTDAAESHDIAKLDLWFFALAYLYRQSLELILKAAIFKFERNLITRKIILGDMRHDLSRGLEILLSYFNATEKGVVNDKLNWLIHFFDDITNVDRESDLFRYPFSLKMRSIFTQQQHVSLDKLQQNFSAAFKTLFDIYNSGNLSIRDYQLSSPILFISGGDYYYQSVIGYSFSIDKFYPYCTSYIEAASFLGDEIISTKNSRLFLPMCYLFRNGLELGLKRLIYEDSSYSKTEAIKIFKKKKHSLQGLWNKIHQEIIGKATGNDDLESIDFAVEYIKEIHAFDNTSSIFRYPCDNDLNMFFSNPLILDITNVAKFFHQIWGFFDAVSSALSVQKEFELEMLYEQQSMVDYYNDYYN